MRLTSSLKVSTFGKEEIHECGRVVATTDSFLTRTRYYDARGEISSRTDSSGSQEQGFHGADFDDFQFTIEEHRHALCKLVRKPDVQNLSNAPRYLG